ncbi:restriction endonuclease subunit S [Ruminococcus sp.]|uniref:restriction endonuclease subunit S n=1 Tax=Ruminococcus sp. TaxID=41978 RepID=UPI003995224C
MTAQQLKNSILQMAVQGKLVPQDPNDEPASVLLERIKAEKEALIKSGKIKKSKKSSEIFRGASRTLPYAFCEQIGKEIRDISDEIPFEIPESWEWVRLGSIVYSRGQMKPTSDFCYVDIGSIDNKNQKLGNTENIITPDKAPSRARKTIDIGDIIYSTVRPYLHNMCIIDKQFSLQPIASTGFATMTCYSGIFNKYLFYYLLAPDFDNYANDTENSKGVAYPAINDDRLYKALIPVAPLAEQKRIVAKIEELLPYIEKYEQAETKLTALNKSFPEMLKKSILQEAVQGKLVPQNPDDEPASILLERIRTEKQELIKQGKIKKSKHESIIVTRDKIPYEIINGKERCIADEVPFEIPESWEWCRLTELSSVITKGSSPKWQGITYVDEKNGILFITSENIGKEKLLMNKAKYVEKKFNDMHSTSILKFGDILTNIVGASIGRTAIYNLNSENSNINQAVCIIRLINLDFRMYIIKFLNSPIAFQMMTNNSVDSARANLSLSSVSNFLIPLPPLAEQKRIVEKIEELMTFCEKLK